ncbi:MAG: methylenetetrahydrofolate reductase [Coriobacteriaceae bacterium]|nr:methylenetetrahydrofolate reductase [Coriobacteriaceae bacterium]
MTNDAPACVSELFCGNQPLSFEIFPPRGDLTEVEARRVAGELVELNPAFISVTYSAGGSGNSGATTTVASLIQNELGVPSVAHLTCQGLTRAMLEEKIAEMRAAGIKNVLALRGDPRPDAPQGDFAYAADVIPVLREAGFCVGAAAYPEGHVTCTSLEDDIAHLREKQDAGAQFLVTQLFFDNEDFFRFRDLAARAGITAPITCGIMPFMSKNQVSRMIFMCGASLPSPIIRLLNRYEGDDEALRRAGIEYAAAQLRGLRDAGADGLHVYTMNKPAVARAICELL